MARWKADITKERQFTILVTSGNMYKNFIVTLINNYMNNYSPIVHCSRFGPFDLYKNIITTNMCEVYIIRNYL